ncbi:MAG: hypothetical protein AAFP93_01175 [Bacteroidota bacterium]
MDVAPVALLRFGAPCLDQALLLSELLSSQAAKGHCPVMLCNQDFFHEFITRLSALEGHRRVHFERTV